MIADVFMAGALYGAGLAAASFFAGYMFASQRALGGTDRDN